VFYFGPERISERYEPDDERKMESWCSELTFKTVLDRISETVAEVNSSIRFDICLSSPNSLNLLQGNLVFIKDMGLCLMPPYRKPATIAPSLRFRGMSHEEQYHSGCKSNGDIQKTLPHCATSVTEPLNPTVIPRNILQSFHFTFLIRHPRLSIPSLYVCSTPPMSSTTGLYGFKSEDTGYDELRRLFDYLRHVNQIGPAVAGQEEEGVEGGQEGKTNSNQVKIVVIDAEDLVNDPENIVKLYCKYVGLPFDLSMLKWDTAEERQRAEEVFGKWPGFHDVAMNSTSIKREEQVCWYYIS